MMSRQPKHKDTVTAVAWVTSDEVVSCGDDQQLLKWNLIDFEAHPLTQLPSNIYPTGMHWFPRGLLRQSTNDVFVLTSTEGKFYIYNRSGRLEKAVDAHKGAALCARWSYDGSSLLTCGEDGTVKMWSRNGMLRSMLAQNGTPVYGVSWSADSAQIVYCCAENCFIKALKSQVWDAYGRPLFTSAPHDYPITSAAWNAEGDLFAVGSFNLIRLCDKAGWSHSLEKLATGSIFAMSWSPDSTQLVAGCANGHLIHAHVIEKRVSWRNLEAIQSKRRTVDVRDVVSDVAREKLEMRDRVTKLALGFEQLVVTTTKQCYIFSAKNWNTPVIIDLKECSVSLIVICEKFFLLVDGGIVQILTYEGRTQSTIKLPSTAQSDTISEQTAALSNDTTAIRDRNDHKIIHLFETMTGKNAGDGKIIHTNDIIEVVIDQCGVANERKVAFVDKSLDCFISLVKTYGISQRIAKLGTMITNIRFNDQTNMLAGLEDNRLVIWSYPSVVFIDKDLLRRTIIEREASDFGKSPYLLAFIGNHVSIRRPDGSLVPCGVSPFPAALSAYIIASKWDQAIRLCRHMREEYLWAMLAAMAANAKNFHAAEIAYGALDEAEKVGFLSELREQSSKDVKAALMTAFTGNIRDADAMLVQTKNIFRAIMFNISLFRWQRALELAVQHKMHLDTVIGYRQRYLQQTGRKETDKNFLQHLAEVEIDWEHIQEKIRQDEEIDQK
ncbi:unnamed protein product [Anisakis simplex]|uniref:Intraflagellar transport protein 80 homolog (inferred by orthology to a human protein) n=1 Tax=Anisakis simplex TaxID=6269 RepID=A0A0M3JWX0_ANISI|nr:unnamed protein product [Anisakis simplex]